MTALALLLSLPAPKTQASRIEELKKDIEAKNSEIKKIEEEIEKYQQEINKSLKQAATLKNAIYRLNATIKKLNTSIYLTEKQIEATSLEIERLNLEIILTQQKIFSNKKGLAESLRRINEAESQSLVEIILKHPHLSDFFNDLERLETFQKEVHTALKSLTDLKASLEAKNEELKKKKEDLQAYRARVIDQKILTDASRRQKSILLSRTKNREAAYRKLVSQRLAQKEALEREIRQLEAQLRIEIDPSSLPPAGHGVLGYPLKNLVLKSCWKGNPKGNCITQFFGNTDFATKNPQIYKGVGHRGVDFRASIGTPVYAAEDGVVRFAYRDKVCPNAYYGGKWVLIDHPNNLSTLYAHLSLIKVYNGQKVKRGQLIGYSGNTGYVTGPHLHFTVLATKAVRITGENGEPPYISRVCGKELKIPLAPHNGYLNPLSYL